MNVSDFILQSISLFCSAPYSISITSQHNTNYLVYCVTLNQEQQKKGGIQFLNYPIFHCTFSNNCQDNYFIRKFNYMNERIMQLENII